VKPTVFALISNGNHNRRAADRITGVLVSRFADARVRWVEYTDDAPSLTKALYACIGGQCRALYALGMPWCADFDGMKRVIRNAVDGVRKQAGGVMCACLAAEDIIDDLALSVERAFARETLPGVLFIDTPADRIQKDSFSLIAGRVGHFPDDPVRRSVLVRLIHSSADFSLAHDLAFSADSVDAALEALRSGKPVITDVGMVAAGIGTLFKHGIECAVTQKNAAGLAQKMGITRTAAGMECLKERLQGAVIAIGNAPTALMQCLRIAQRDGIRPVCIIGCPVGFVGAAESKEELIRSRLPYITIRGNRGGSAMAAAILNALGQYI